MNKERTYNTKDLIDTYIASQKPDHVDFIHYYSSLLLALQKAFHITITSNEGVESNKRAIYMLFQSAVRSFITIQTPGSAFSDASLIEKQLEVSPIGDDIQRAMNSINAITEENKKLHRELIETLFYYLYNPKDVTVTSQDLYKMGFDDNTKPNPDDYEY